MNAPILIPEIWSMVFQFLDAKNDLRNVCGVCKLFDSVATPFLYRSLIFRGALIGRNDWSKLPDDEDVKTQDEADDLSFGLLCRILDDRNEVLRRFVREIIFEKGNRTDPVWRVLQPPNDVLAILVTKLPNLKAIHFHSELPVTDGLVNALFSHKKSPKLHLLGEIGGTRIDTKMPFVQRLHTSVNATAIFPRARPDAERRSGVRPWRRQELALHDLFNAFPNLAELSVSVNRLRGGCIMGGPPPSTLISSLKLSEDETFPPLERLSLSGYDVSGDEAALWRDRFPWDRLQSLSIGPQDNPGLLKLATGKVLNLKEFQITSYEPLSFPAELDDFLCSMDSLESLIAKGAVPSLTSVLHQSNLKHVCLHDIEEPDRERQALDAEQIRKLSLNCAKLQTLEIDLDPNGKWPRDITTALATGFKDLRRLYVHVGLGIAHVEEPSTMSEVFPQVLTQSKAQDFAKQFFDLRGPSALKEITLRTGENLRWFPQWRPAYAREEESCENTFKFCAPLEVNNEPRLFESDTAEDRLTRELLENEMAYQRRFNPKPKPQRLSRSPRIFKDPAFPLPN
ncbi:hypothetical protein F1880_001867 [Penicillium rolfsii]|nr:hypothetical protein F1880_001867 [Penicillium rolfsii]